MSSAELTGVAGWMATILATAGPPGVGLIVLVENLFPPIPSEAVLPAAGFLAAQGEFGVVPATVWATAGSVVGALLLYGGGRWIGDRRMTALIDRIPLMSTADAERAWSAFDRFGEPAVLWGRMVPGVRSLVSIPAGARGMALGPFLARTLVGSAAWNSVLIGAGFGLGDSFSSAAVAAEWANRLVYLAVAVGAALLVGGRVRRRVGRGASSIPLDQTGDGSDALVAASASMTEATGGACLDGPLRRAVRVRQPGEQVRVLLVEDDRRLGLLIRQLLEEDGYETTWVDQISLALEALHIDDFDVVVSDFNLPDGIGLDILRASAPPVVVCTGRDDPDVLGQVRSEGAAEVLIKPFSLDDLRSILAAIVDRV